MSKKTVLLADDVELFLELEKTFFRREKIQLLVARNGVEAFEIIASRRPDLVLMDLYMPVMNGDECCRLVKKDPELQRVPVVMVTQAGKEADLERCRAAGCDDILLKPINRHYFLATARRFLSIADRAEPRIQTRISVRYGAGEGEQLVHFTLNMSSGGLFLETEQVLPCDTPLQLSFLLPQRAEPVRCRGRVAWVNDPVAPANPSLPAGMGVQFLDLSIDDLDAVRQYLKRECLRPSF